MKKIIFLIILFFLILHVMIGFASPERVMSSPLQFVQMKETEGLSILSCYIDYDISENGVLKPVANTITKIILENETDQTVFLKLAFVSNEEDNEFKAALDGKSMNGYKEFILIDGHRPLYGDLAENSAEERMNFRTLSPIYEEIEKILSEEDISYEHFYEASLLPHHLKAYLFEAAIEPGEAHELEFFWIDSGGASEKSYALGFYSSTRFFDYPLEPILAGDPEKLEINIELDSYNWKSAEDGISPSGFEWIDNKAAAIFKEMPQQNLKIKLEHSFFPWFNAVLALVVLAVSGAILLKKEKIDIT